MADPQRTQRLGKDLEAEVWNAISAFEQILEAMPTDRASLDALANAYEQIGDETKAQEYLARLARVLIDENDAKSAADLLPRLKTFSAKNDQFRELAGRIEHMMQRVTAAPPAPEAAKTSQKAAAPGEALLKAGFNIQEEISFAWMLAQANQVTQEEYANIVQDLTDMSGSADRATASVLHAIENRGFRNLEKILAFASRECGTPFVMLSSFHMTAEAVSLLPLNVMRRCGVLPFETLGKEVLVVVMNPHDRQLRKDVEAALGRKCHFFVTLASEFDRALEKIPAILEQAKGKA